MKVQVIYFWLLRKLEFSYILNRQCVFSWVDQCGLLIIAHMTIFARYNDVLFSHIVTTKLTRSVVIYLSKEATKVFMYIQTAIL